MHLCNSASGPQANLLRVPVVRGKYAIAYCGSDGLPDLRTPTGQQLERVFRQACLACAREAVAIIETAVTEDDVDGEWIDRFTDLRSAVDDERFWTKLRYASTHEDMSRCRGRAHAISFVDYAYFEGEVLSGADEETALERVFRPWLKRVGAWAEDDLARPIPPPKPFGGEVRS